MVQLLQQLCFINYFTQQELQEWFYSTRARSSPQVQESREGCPELLPAGLEEPFQ